MYVRGLLTDHCAIARLLLHSEEPKIEFSFPKTTKFVLAFSMAADGIVWGAQPHFHMAFPGETKYTWGPHSSALDLRLTTRVQYNHTFDVVEGYAPAPADYVHPVDKSVSGMMSKMTS